MHERGVRDDTSHSVLTGQKSHSMYSSGRAHFLPASTAQPETQTYTLWKNYLNVWHQSFKAWVERTQRATAPIFRAQTWNPRCWLLKHGGLGISVSSCRSEVDMNMDELNILRRRAFTRGPPKSHTRACRNKQTISMEMEKDFVCKAGWRSVWLRV